MPGRTPARRLLRWLNWGLCLLACSQGVLAAEPPGGPAIALIIDDLGNQRAAGERVVALPGRVTCAFLPHTPYAAVLAEAAHRSGKEVMLHLPMQPVEPRALGPGGLTLDMTREAFLASLQASLASIPHVRGVNNHMGSLLTRHPGHMDWLMQRLADEPGLFFVDSRTTAKTVAYRIAQERRIPFLQRDVFLDAKRGDRAYVAAQWERLLEQARRRGYALGIGHPYAETMAVLEQALPRLRAEGIELLPVSELIDLKERRQLWQASLSPSPKAVKN